MSDDGRWAIVVIAMVGHPFSPDYARARERGPADPLRFCSMNVALYGPNRRTSGFSLQEGAIDPEHRRTAEVQIDRSTVGWQGDRLVVELDVLTTAVWPRAGRPIRGRITLRPEAQPGVMVELDQARQHRWWPVAPLARVEVELVEPAVRFSGHGYHDVNAGDVPLSETFDTWTWSRARVSETRACLVYDVRDNDGHADALAFSVDASGGIAPLPALSTVALPRSRWALPQHTRADPGTVARVVRRLEDGPFYARSVVETTIDGRRCPAVHETLTGRRLDLGWVRFCTRYRMRPFQPTPASMRPK